MPDMETVATWRGRTMVDRDGDRIGTIGDVYLDDETGQPEWALVDTGLFKNVSAFVPLTQATPAGDQVRVPYGKAMVEDAPHMDPDGRLSQQEEAELYRFYGLEYGPARAGRQAGAAGQEVSGPATDDAMTRSEEELRVGTTREERGRVRLRKYVVTEQVEQTVPVSREEVRVEREPITDANLDAATSGPAIGDEEHEVVLHEERPVVDKQTVPKERIRLDKDVVTDEREISEEVRKEQVELEGPGDDRRPNDR